jgi:hypothetical protein
LHLGLGFCDTRPTGAVDSLCLKRGAGISVTPASNKEQLFDIMTAQIYVGSSFYFPGDTIRGFIMLSLAESMEVSSITMKLKGYEFCFIRRSAMDTENIDKVSTIARSTVFEETNNFRLNGETFSAGEHRLPFEVRLKEDLFESVTFEDYFIFKRSYKLKATLARPGLFTSDLKADYRVMIYRKPAPMPTPMAVSSETTSEEPFILSAQTCKSVYRPGEDCVIKFMIDARHSLLKVLVVSVTLIEEATVSNRWVKYVGRTPIPLPVALASSPVAAGTLVNRSVPFSIPTSCSQSTSSPTMNVDHRIELVVSVVGGSELVLRVPVKVEHLLPTRHPLI